MEFGIPHLFAWLIAAIHGLGVLAAIHAVLTVRTAQGALAWGLSLFFMPYLTLLPYLVFGRSRFDAYVKDLRTRYDKLVIRKPAASRRRSNEVYALALGKRRGKN